MATIPDQTHPSLSASFSANTDFTLLAEHCEHLATGLLENSAPPLRMAFCGRLATCLDLLRPGLYDPIPPHLQESLTTDTLPDQQPEFAPDPELLCEYCHALTQVLLAGGVSAQVEKTLTGLLYELVCFFSDGLRAPRWIRTPEGVKFIEDAVKH
ncbi:hypothetical protein [Superficieibacter sp. HKU1]|uniref:hypothetical protein n=1 Tax=Superficieibacter sp. HKU1 TaxID=3031919 RepID=UPI0023E0C5A0|nr:hypothetical protein [Superficieibacter sp. HKU1]WES69055.1 hypothetical protein P0H77_03290 [Superficieibacter sp. HKU1]